MDNTAEADWISWGQVAAENGFRVMVYDVPTHLPYDQGKNPVFVSVRGDGEAEITAFWEKLKEGSSMQVPLAPAQWAPLYGMLTDRFGVVWVLDVAAAYQG